MCKPGPKSPWLTPETIANSLSNAEASLGGVADVRPRRKRRRGLGRLADPRELPFFEC